MSRLLVVVDMQKDFVDGALGTKEAQAIVPAVEEKIKAYQAAGETVVFTLDTHGPDYPATQEGRRLPVPHCIKGTPGWELADTLKELAGTRFEKGTFGSRELAEYVRDGGFSQAEVVGFPTPFSSRPSAQSFPSQWMRPAVRASVPRAMRMR